jgi:glycosyltransferase involved in cell wall biosynthesis
MKVLVIGAYPSKENPAKGVFIEQQVESLRAAGLSVDVLPIYGGRGKKKYIHAARQFHSMIRSASYDLIHAHHVYAGVIARTQWRVPVVVTHHGSEVIAEGALLRGLCKAITCLADGSISVSQEVADALNHPRVTVIPCGIDMDRFRPMPREQARAQLGLPSDRTYLLYTGDFDGVHRPMKRFDLIEDAHRILKLQFPNFEILNVQNQPNERMPLFINAANVLVLASECEGSPMVIKEAMACNLPVVSVDVGDVANVIAGTDNCYLCERTADDIADKCSMVLGRADARSDGRSHIEAYALNRIASRIIDVYEGCVAHMRASKALPA